jgi:hypothetical protein
MKYIKASKFQFVSELASARRAPDLICCRAVEVEGIWIPPQPVVFILFTPSKKRTSAAIWGVVSQSTQNRR